MVDVTQTRPVVTALELQDGQVVEFADEGQVVNMRTPDGVERVRLIIGLRGFGKPIVVNETSKTALARAYGRDTKDWVGKKAKVHITSRNIAGREVDVVFLYPMVEARKGK